VSNRELAWTSFATMSVWAWYCIVTIPTNTWLHCSSKQSSAFESLRKNTFNYLFKIVKNFQPVEESTLLIWHWRPLQGTSPCDLERRTKICCRREVPGTSETVSGPGVGSAVGKRRRCSTQSDWSFDKNLELFAWNGRFILLIYCLRKFCGFQLLKNCNQFPK